MYCLIFKDLTGRICFKEHYLSKPSDERIEAIRLKKSQDLDKILLSTLEVNKFTGINKNYANLG